jgi:NodT family efflux transporter outer membrane factor (OMF) lipoprotein
VGRRRQHPRVWIEGLLALLCGCAVGPDFVRPEPPATAGYTREPMPTQLAPAAGGAEQNLGLAQEISAQWWELFGSGSLDEVVARAIGANPSLASARATLAQAQESVAAARGALFPQLDLGARVDRVHVAGLRSDTPSSTTSLYSAGPSVSYLVDVFGVVRRSVEQQAALAELQHYELAAAWLSLTGNTVEQCIAIASLRAQIAAIEDVVGDDEQNLSLVERKFTAGKAARLDVLTAETQLASDRAQLPPLRQALAAAHHALSVLAGELPAEWSPPDFTLEGLELPRELPLSLPSQLVRQRPDILASEAQLHAASAAIGVATAQLYPNFTLSGSVAQQALQASSFFTAGGAAWALGAQAAAPLFHGGTLRAERRGAIDAYEASLATYEQVVLQAFQQVADVLRALAHDAELVDAQQALLDAARDALALQRISYAAGKTDLLQLLDAQRSYQQARLGFAGAQGQRLRDTAQLFVALGGGWWQAGI